MRAKADGIYNCFCCCCCFLSFVALIHYCCCCNCHSYYLYCLLSASWHHCYQNCTDKKQRLYSKHSQGRGGSYPSGRVRSFHYRSNAYLLFLLLRLFYSFDISIYLYTYLRVDFFSCYEDFLQAILIILMQCIAQSTAFNQRFLNKPLVIRN